MPTLRASSLYRDSGVGGLTVKSGMINRLPKEKCDHCSKVISLGLPHFECYNCTRILHAKCFKASKAEVVNDNFYCTHCKHSISKKYNPFKLMTDPELNECDPCLQKIADILESCRSYSINDMNTLIKPYFENNCSMIFQNIDGNRTNFDAFSVELDRISQKFQVIGLAETNVGTDESDVYQIEGYNCFYQDKHINKIKGTGVALYLTNKLNGVVNDDLSWVSKNLESLFITIQHDEPVHVGVLYRPPSGDSVEALNEFKKIIELCPKNNTYILGDFNVNLHDESNKLFQDFENLILSSGLTPLISTQTHQKPGCKPTCIDNILSNNTEHSVCSGTIPTCISHHHAVFHLFQSSIISKDSHEPKHYQFYDYSTRNVGKFVNALERELTAQSPGDFDQFFSIFNDQLDTACKLDQPKYSKRTAKNNPWITSGLTVSIDRKHFLYDAWKKAEKEKCLHPSEKRQPNCDCANCKNEIACHTEFRAHRKLTTHLINCAKRKYLGGKINECIGDSRKTWQVINDVRGKKKRVIKPNFVIDNERIINRRVIANEFNKYFASIASNLNQSHTGNNPNSDSSSTPSFTDYLPKSTSSSVFLHDCDVAEITEIINELKNGKSSDIPIHVVKNSCQVIAPYLVNYFNKCLQEGHFPDELKTGRISPIYKKENEQLIENYRPVSTLPVFGKILEKLIYSRLYSFFTSKGIIHENQFGFRKGHSTSHALNYSVEHIESLLRNKQHVLGVFIDLSKAFDTIDHRKLITKLNNYGIRGNALKLISSYLTNRKQYVSVLDVKSNELPVEFGVPQGSVLGPLLFILYINDICKLTDKGKFVLFADDTNIFVAADSREKAYDMANEVLLVVSHYMKVNLLHINVKKCCYMYFSPSKRSKNGLDDELNDQNLSINSEIIKRVNQTKFLGVIIDDKLTWKPHILSLNKKLRSACGRICQIRKCLPESLYKLIYHSLFESHLGYAISVWGGISNNQLKPLFITQKKCIRILFGDHESYIDKFMTCARTRPYHFQRLGSKFYAKESTKPLFTKHEILAAENLYRHRCLMELFKILKSRTPISLFSLFSISNRKDNLLITPCPTSQFMYKSAWLWNEFRKVSHLNFTSSCSSVKNFLKQSLLSVQNRYGADWCNNNFTEF